MAVMPLVPETKTVDVGKLIRLRNLLARKTTWLVLTTTSATSILSRVFAAYCMTRIVYKYTHLPSPPFLRFSFTWSFSFQCDFQRVNTHFLLFTFDIQQSTATEISTPCNHSLPCYTLSVRLFPASNTDISSKHRKKQTVEILRQHA